MTTIDPAPAPVTAMAPLSLAELEADAGLLTRVDRKYLLPATELAAMIGGAAADWEALEIDGRRGFRYESCYFDTADLDAFLGAAFKRRHRFKVRTRTYVESGACVLEVKTKGRRGETVKVRQSHGSRPDRLTGDDAAFVDAATGLEGIGARLRPVLATNYLRSTIVDRRRGARVTIDQELATGRPAGPLARFDELLIVETKTAGSPTEVDRWLWRHGHRPQSISKFCVGMALLDPALPANRWHRVIHRHLARRDDLAVAPG